MKRIALIVMVVCLGAFASAASAAPGGSAAAHRMSATVTEWTFEENVAAFYGGVKCHGKTVVNKKHPEGVDVEFCETTEGTLKNMTAGKGQKTFHGEGGIEYNEWQSDSGDGKRTTNYSYSVNKKLTHFKLVAIY